MTTLTHKRAKVNGVTLHYVTAGSGPTVLCMHGWPQNHREFLPVIEGLAEQYAFIAPDLRGYADSDKPYDGYEPKTIAEDMLALLDVEDVENFHILSHDLGGPPSVALAYLASGRAVSLATFETPFFGLNYPGYVDPRVTYWHLGMHMNMDITRLLSRAGRSSTCGTSSAISPITRRRYPRVKYSSTSCISGSQAASARA